MEIKLTKEVVDSWQILQDYDKITVVPFVYDDENFDPMGSNDYISSGNKLDRLKWLDEIIKYKGFGMSFTYNPQHTPMEIAAPIIQAMSNAHTEAHWRDVNSKGYLGCNYQGLYFYDKNSRMVGCIEGSMYEHPQYIEDPSEGYLYASDYAIENYNKKHAENQLSR